MLPNMDWQQSGSLPPMQHQPAQPQVSEQEPQAHQRSPQPPPPQQSAQPPPPQQSANEQGAAVSSLHPPQTQLLQPTQGPQAPPTHMTQPHGPLAQAGAPQVRNAVPVMAFPPAIAAVMQQQQQQQQQQLYQQHMQGQQQMQHAVRALMMPMPVGQTHFPGAPVSQATAGEAITHVAMQSVQPMPPLESNIPVPMNSVPSSHWPHFARQLTNVEQGMSFADRWDLLRCQAFAMTQEAPQQALPRRRQKRANMPPSGPSMLSLAASHSPGTSEPSSPLPMVHGEGGDAPVSAVFQGIVVLEDDTPANRAEAGGAAAAAHVQSPNWPEMRNEYDDTVDPPSALKSLHALTSQEACVAANLDEETATDSNTDCDPELGVQHKEQESHMQASPLSVRLEMFEQHWESNISEDPEPVHGLSTSRASRRRRFLVLRGWREFDADELAEMQRNGENPYTRRTEDEDNDASNSRLLFSLRLSRDGRACELLHLVRNSCRHTPLHVDATEDPYAELEELSDLQALADGQSREWHGNLTAASLFLVDQLLRALRPDALYLYDDAKLHLTDARGARHAVLLRLVLPLAVSSRHERVLRSDRAAEAIARDPSLRDSLPLKVDSLELTQDERGSHGAGIDGRDGTLFQRRLAGTHVVECDGWRSRHGLLRQSWREYEQALGFLRHLPLRSLCEMAPAQTERVVFDLWRRHLPDTVRSVLMRDDGSLELCSNAEIHQVLSEAASTVGTRSQQQQQQQQQEQRADSDDKQVPAAALAALAQEMQSARKKRRIVTAASSAAVAQQSTGESDDLADEISDAEVLLHDEEHDDEEHDDEELSDDSNGDDSTQLRRSKRARKTSARVRDNSSLSSALTALVPGMAVHTEPSMLPLPGGANSLHPVATAAAAPSAAADDDATAAVQYNARWHRGRKRSAAAAFAASLGESETSSHASAVPPRFIRGLPFLPPPVALLALNRRMTERERRVLVSSSYADDLAKQQELLQLRHDAASLENQHKDATVGDLFARVWSTLCLARHRLRSLRNKRLRLLQQQIPEGNVVTEEEQTAQWQHDLLVDDTLKLYHAVLSPFAARSLWRPGCGGDKFLDAVSTLESVVLFRKLYRDESTDKVNADATSLPMRFPGGAEQQVPHKRRRSGRLRNKTQCVLRRLLERRNCPVSGQPQMLIECDLSKLPPQLQQGHEPLERWERLRQWLKWLLRNADCRSLVPDARCTALHSLPVVSVPVMPPPSATHASESGAAQRMQQQQQQRRQHPVQYPLQHPLQQSNMPNSSVPQMPPSVQVGIPAMNVAPLPKSGMPTPPPGMSWLWLSNAEACILHCLSLKPEVVLSWSDEAYDGLEWRHDMPGDLRLHKRLQMLDNAKHHGEPTNEQGPEVELRLLPDVPESQRQLVGGLIMFDPRHQSASEAQHFVSKLTLSPYET
ncbi:MAG: hypothetical protein MHM6MM_006276 [Cercozoa sp. M6MM]